MESSPSQASPLQFTELVSTHVVNLFREILEVGKSEHSDRDTYLVLPPIALSLGLAAECEHAAQTLAAAFRNRSKCFQMISGTPSLAYLYDSVTIPWDMPRYSARWPKSQKITEMEQMLESMAKRYPPLDPPIYVSKPATFIDEHGHIIAWYLPDVLFRRRQVRLHYALKPTFAFTDTN
jgi:hypothetical protein